jgi:transposase InsO family protein
MRPGYDIADYFAWYNTQRPHSSLERITPEQVYLDLLPKLAEAA